MHLGIKKLITILIVFVCTACGSSSQSTSPTKEVDLSGFAVSMGDQYSSKVRDYLTSWLESERNDVDYSYISFFIKSYDVEVVSDPDYNNLVVKARSELWGSTADLKIGRQTAFPTIVSSSMPDLDEAERICAKEVMYRLTRGIVGEVISLGYLVNESLKIEIEFYTVTGETKEDMYGNQDTSGLKEKVLANTLIHISEANLKKISDAWGPDDYYALSDLSKPIRHPSSWNQCRRTPWQ